MVSPWASSCSALATPTLKSLRDQLKLVESGVTIGIRGWPVMFHQSFIPIHLNRITLGARDTLRALKSNHI